MGYVLKLLGAGILVIVVALSVAYCVGGDGDEQVTEYTEGTVVEAEETTEAPETTTEETIVTLPNTGGSS